MPTATTRASIMPARPPSMLPMAMNSAVIAAIRTAVFNMLNIVSGLLTRLANEDTTPWWHG